MENLNLGRGILSIRKNPTRFSFTTTIVPTQGLNVSSFKAFTSVLALHIVFIEKTFRLLGISQQPPVI